MERDVVGNTVQVVGREMVGASLDGRTADIVEVEWDALKHTLSWMAYQRLVRERQVFIQLYYQSCLAMSSTQKWLVRLGMVLVYQLFCHLPNQMQQSI